ncbi:hypothetical protein SNEBB_003334 [Seison nebaliae]|nr:hypothetical protein SNEBB_003334 [Seison nebaliae]
MSDSDEFSQSLDEEEAGDEMHEEETKKTVENVVVPLDDKMVGENLSLLGKCGNGMNYAFLRLELIKKNLTSVTILKKFVNICYLNLSSNSLTGPDTVNSLNYLIHLLTLNLDDNKIESLSGFQPLPYLQIFSCKKNVLTTISTKNINDGFSHPRLTKLYLSNNEIEIIEELSGQEVLVNLSYLDLSHNKIRSIEKMNIPSLKTLYLGYNDLRTLRGLENLTGLVTFHARKNNLTELHYLGENLTSLIYFNIRENNVEELRDVKRLQRLPKLESLILLDNPITAALEDYRSEVLQWLPTLNRLDKEAYSPEEKEDAQEIIKGRTPEDMPSDRPDNQSEMDSETLGDKDTLETKDAEEEEE